MIKIVEEGKVKIKGRRYRKGKYTRKRERVGESVGGGGLNEGQGKLGQNFRDTVGEKGVRMYCKCLECV
jgi:hypothetical protein